MSRLITVTCDRCGASDVGKPRTSGPGVSAPKGWRYLSRDIDLCPPCGLVINKAILGDSHPIQPNDTVQAMSIDGTRVVGVVTSLAYTPEPAVVNLLVDGKPSSWLRDDYTWTILEARS